MNFIKKEDLKFLIAILSPIIMFVVAFYVLQNDFKYQSEKIVALEVERDKSQIKFEELQNRFTDIQITLAQIQKDIFYIKQKLD